MAVGDAVIAQSWIGSGSALTIQPGTGVEWELHDLWVGQSATLYRTDGTNHIQLDSVSGSSRNWNEFHTWHLTDAVYLRIVNDFGSNSAIGYSGVVTRDGGASGIGAKVVGHSNVTAGASLDIQPGGTAEWLIHEIWTQDAHSIYRNDGTHLAQLFANNLGESYNGGFVWRVNNGVYLSVKNDAASTKRIGFAGIITKV